MSQEQKPSNITELYREATTPPLTEEQVREQQAKQQAAAADAHRQAEERRQQVESYKRGSFSKIVNDELVQRIGTLDQHISYMVASAHESDLLLRAAAMEKLTLQKVAALLNGDIITINPTQQNQQ